MVTLINALKVNPLLSRVIMKKILIKTGDYALVSSSNLASYFSDSVFIHKSQNVKYKP